MCQRISWIPSSRHWGLLLVAKVGGRPSTWYRCRCHSAEQRGRVHPRYRYSRSPVHSILPFNVAPQCSQCDQTKSSLAVAQCYMNPAHLACPPPYTPLPPPGAPSATFNPSHPPNLPHHPAPCLSLLPSQCFLEALQRQTTPHDGVEATGVYMREVYYRKQLPCGLKRGADLM